MVILVGTAHSIKMVKYDEKIDYESYVSSVIYIPIIGTIVLLLIARFINIFSQNFAELPVSMWQTLFITAGIGSIINIVSSKLILEGEYKVYIASSLINTIVNIGLSIILCYTIYSTSNTYCARIYGGLAAEITNCVFLIFFFRPSKPRIEYIKTGVLLGLPLLVHSIATQILVQSDKIIISQLCSYSVVGIYTAAANIVVIPITLMSSIEHSWSPWYYECLSKCKYEEIRDKNTKIVLLFAIGIVLFMLASPEIVHLMLNNDYWEAIYVLIPLTFSVFVELIYIIPLNLELYYKKNTAIWVYTVLIVVFNIIFDALLIKFFGFLAGAYVTCISRFLLFLLHYIRAKKIDKHDIMNLKVLTVLIILLIAVNLFVVSYVDFLMARWSVIVIIIVGCVIALPKYRHLRRED